MGSALYELKKRLKGQKLDDGKTIGRLTKEAIESLQTYYGKAIRGDVGDVEAMMKAVQATSYVTFLGTNICRQDRRMRIITIKTVSTNVSLVELYLDKGADVNRQAYVCT